MVWAILQVIARTDQRSPWGTLDTNSKLKSSKFSSHSNRISSRWWKAIASDRKMICRSLRLLQDPYAVGRQFVCTRKRRGEAPGYVWPLHLPHKRRSWRLSVETVCNRQDTVWGLSWQELLSSAIWYARSVGAHFWRGCPGGHRKRRHYRREIDLLFLLLGKKIDFRTLTSLFISFQLKN